jgi:hypothetical protein
MTRGTSSRLHSTPAHRRVVPMTALSSNTAAHPEPLKRRSLWHSSSRRPGGRER